MRIALLSDVHSNIDALETCLRDANQRGATRFAFLGDHVGYGAAPVAVVETIAEHARRGAIVVKGNHDLEQPSDAEDALEWTLERLSAQQKEFLRSLPLTAKEESMFFVHSSAIAPQRWMYIEDATAARQSIEASGATYVFSGHVHDQVLYFLTQTGKIASFHPISGSAVPVPSHRRWQAIVGSVGQPRDGNPAAAYALFDSEKEEITFFRVAYDHMRAARRIREAGLPESLALRIENGR